MVRKRASEMRHTMLRWSTVVVLVGATLAVRSDGTLS